jgi:hypothetical protein
VSEEEEDSEDARASRREDRAFGCGMEAIGCGFDLALVALLVPLAFCLL